MDSLAPLFDGSLAFGTQILLFVSLAIALGFEFVNGFHDTANAVATVIYTNSLPPRVAVLWSGLCNFAGVCLGGTAVAFSILNLLPTELLLTTSAGQGLAMVLALLIAAIAWNFGTWYLAIPASSSHTLIGSILGVGLANSLLPGHTFGSGVNWTKAGEVGMSLLVSPLVGFSLAFLLLRLLMLLVRTPALYQPPTGKEAPPWWIRGTLIFTCTGVSLAHGSNDGQKGIGLVMLILIAVVPAGYALDPRGTQNQAPAVLKALDEAEVILNAHDAGGSTLSSDLADLRTQLRDRSALKDVPPEDRSHVRNDLIRIDNQLNSLLKKDKALSADEKPRAKAARETIRAAVYYAPTWVLAAVATALGVGTTVGWKRIVVTVGEKIGKSHLTFAQGAAAELVAMTTIGIADISGLPVSTTQVLSSGVAGTMAANRSGVQMGTVRSIAIAWLLTLPVSMVLSGTLFIVFRLFAR